MISRKITRWLLPLLLIAAVGCDDDIQTNNPLLPPDARQRAAGKKPKTATKKGDKPGGDQKLPSITFTDADFIESERSRDPFRDFRHLFVRRPDGQRAKQRAVKASQYALDELKLEAIIARRIMLTDPTGHGWIVYNGDFVGKPEMVSAGGTDGAEFAINWRVDRIRPNDVVFIREDASHPEIPPTTRVVPLYPVGEGT